MSIIGFGSLLSEKSSRFTFPHLENFRVARLRGFRRVFAHVTPFFLSACAPNSSQPCWFQPILCMRCSTSGAPWAAPQWLVCIEMGCRAAVMMETPIDSLSVETYGP